MKRLHWIDHRLGSLATALAYWAMAWPAAAAESAARYCSGRDVQSAPGDGQALRLARVCRTAFQQDFDRGLGSWQVKNLQKALAIETVDDPHWGPGLLVHRDDRETDTAFEISSADDGLGVPGPAAAATDGCRLVMSNHVIEARWDLSSGKMRLVEVVDRAAGGRLAADSGLFAVKLADGSRLSAEQLRPLGPPGLQRIAAQLGAVRLADRSAGWRAEQVLASGDGRWRFRWQAILRDESNYVRQLLTVLGHEGSRPIEIQMFDLPAGEAKPCGVVDGSPLVSGNFFFAFFNNAGKNLSST